MDLPRFPDVPIVVLGQDQTLGQAMDKLKHLHRKTARTIQVIEENLEKIDVAMWG
jgi:hypothetical protein